MWHIYINKDSKKDVRNVIEDFLDNLNPSSLVALILRAIDTRNFETIQGAKNQQRKPGAVRRALAALLRRARWSMWLLGMGMGICDSHFDEVSWSDSIFFFLNWCTLAL